MSENAATRALEIVLRREWNRTFDTNDPYARAFEQRRVENMIRKIPKTSRRIATLVGNVSSNTSTIAALTRAVDAGDLAAIRKLYRPEFFFDVLRRNRAATNVMNAILPATMRRSRSPEALLRRLLDLGTEIFPAMPTAVARIATTTAVPVEKLVSMAVAAGTSSPDLLAIFKTLETSRKKKLDFSKVGETDVFLLFVNRHDEYIDSAENSPPMDVLTLLKFMNTRGAPLVPLEEIMRYVDDYESEIGGNRENRPEFHALLRLYN